MDIRGNRFLRVPSGWRPVRRRPARQSRVQQPLRAERQQPSVHERSRCLPDDAGPRMGGRRYPVLRSNSDGITDRAQFLKELPTDCNVKSFAVADYKVTTETSDLLVLLAFSVYIGRRKLRQLR